MSSHEPTEVYAARDEIDATLVQSMLGESGIEARVVGGQIIGAVGEVPAGLPSAPRVWVAEESAAEAKKLIREMEEKRRETWLQHSDADDEETEPSEGPLGKKIATVAALGAALILGAPPGNLACNETGGASVKGGETWECSGCHESVTVDFEICWNCQQPREGTDLES